MLILPTFAPETILIISISLILPNGFIARHISIQNEILWSFLQLSSVNLLHICCLKLLKAIFIHIVTNHKDSYENWVLLFVVRNILEIKSTNLILFWIIHVQSFSDTLLKYKHGFVGCFPLSVFFKVLFYCFLTTEGVSTGLKPKHETQFQVVSLEVSPLHQGQVPMTTWYTLCQGLSAQHTEQSAPKSTFTASQLMSKHEEACWEFKTRSNTSQKTYEVPNALSTFINMPKMNTNSQKAKLIHLPWLKLWATRECFLFFLTSVTFK